MKTSCLREALKQFPVQPQEAEPHSHTHFYPEESTSCIFEGIEDSEEDTSQLHPLGLQDQRGLQAPCCAGQVGKQFLGQHRVAMRRVSSVRTVAPADQHFDTMASDIQRLGAPRCWTPEEPAPLSKPACLNSMDNSGVSETQLGLHNRQPLPRIDEAGPFSPTSQTLPQPPAAYDVTAMRRECAFAGLGLSGCTTVAIWNLPKHLTQIGLVFRLNACGFEGMFDFIYMPGRRTKHGMAFVNFKSTRAADEFYRRYQGKYWPQTANKPIRVTPADVQGFERNVQRFAEQSAQGSSAATRPLCLRS
mmetsp:Transcript_44844/g.129692  ORF Transcript_44844/g.129692 Transcript_44844/m.129692 type:complete len:304 (+) Transcript_44844:91-1002(+)